jgi:hypothetical protein
MDTQFVTIMFDTLYMKIPTIDTHKAENVLTGCKFDFDKGTGVITKQRGRLGNLRVAVSDQDIFIAGSLAVYYFGDNFKTHTRQTTRYAIEKLSDDLGVEIKDAEVYRLDFAENFNMNEAVQKYLNCLPFSVRYFEKEKYPENGNVLFRNKRRAISVYDKVLEATSKGKPIPYELNATNMLRYELRFLRKIAHSLDRPYPIRAGMLYEAGFFSYLVNKYKTTYADIKKNRPYTGREKITLSSIKGFERGLAFYGLHRLGHENIIRKIDQAKASRKISKTQAFRLKIKVTEIYNFPGIADGSADLMLELDKKVQQIEAN